VALARSDRTLVRWQQSPDPGPARPADGSVEDVRDPFVFEFEGHRYAVQGAGSRSGPPQLLLYGCDDLQAWTPLGGLLDTDDPVAAAVAPAEIWECPNLVQVDGVWVLLVSLWRWADGSHQLAGVRYLLGDVVRSGDGLRFRAESGGVLNEGPAFYAPQALADSDRVLVWGWAWELDRTAQQVEAAGWAGVLTFPRELSLRTDAQGRRILASRPARELTDLRTGVLPADPGVPLVEPGFRGGGDGAGPAVAAGRGGDGPCGGERGQLGRARSAARGRQRGGGVRRRPLVDHPRLPTPDTHWQLDGRPDRLVVHRLGLGGGH
jgi:beta-fructofuranosidase